MIPEALTEKLHEIIEHLMRTGFAPPLFFACIAADGCTMTGSYDTDHRVVVPPPAQAELPLPINVLIVDHTAKARHITISQANDL